MNSTELMIGNLVSVFSFDLHDISEVTCISKDGVSLQSENNIYVFENYDDIIGIQLTPEWLIKAGAVNRHGCEYYIGKLKFTYEHNELSQFVRFHYSGKVAYFQYLHELQNLYFAICRNELQIALS